jgi:5-methylcytosine-specific restriction endonuclease McrA
MKEYVPVKTIMEHKCSKCSKTFTAATLKKRNGVCGRCAKASDPKAKDGKTPIPKKVRTEVWKKRLGNVIEGKCYPCERLITFDDFHCGHIISERNGGRVHIDNLRPICRGCNLSMGTMDMEEFKAMLVEKPKAEEKDILNLSKLQEMLPVMNIYPPVPKFDLDRKEIQALEKYKVDQDPKISIFQKMVYDANPSAIPAKIGILHEVEQSMMVKCDKYLTLVRQNNYDTLYAAECRMLLGWLDRFANGHHDRMLAWTYLTVWAFECRRLYGEKFDTVANDSGLVRIMRAELGLD